MGTHLLGVLLRRKTETPGFPVTRLRSSAGKCIAPFRDPNDATIGVTPYRVPVHIREEIPLQIADDPRRVAVGGDNVHYPEMFAGRPTVGRRISSVGKHRFMAFVVKKSPGNKSGRAEVVIAVDFTLPAFQRRNDVPFDLGNGPVTVMGIHGDGYDHPQCFEDIPRSRIVARRHSSFSEAVLQCLEDGFEKVTDQSPLAGDHINRRGHPR